MANQSNQCIMYTMNIGNHATDERVFIIAEIGANHEGDIKRAKNLMQLAKESGADAVKFQTYHPTRLVHAMDTDRRRHFQKLALSESEFKDLAQYASTNDILFFSTPFDLESVDLLINLGVPAIKIASGDITYWPLIQKIADSGLPIILSTGVSDFTEIKSVTDRLFHYCPAINDRIGILHCVSMYPTPPAQAHLGDIHHLKTLFPTIDVGYSCHVTGNVACLAAVAMGARIIEKHFTDDHNFSSFRDHQLSATPSEFRDLVDQVRQLELMMGTSDTTTVGHETFHLFRRSVAARIPIPIGTEITREMLTCLRPEIGIPALDFDTIIGKKTTQTLDAGEIISPTSVQLS